MMKVRKALIVEDDETICELLDKILRRHFGSIQIANDGRTAIEILKGGDYDVVVLDLMLPEVNGLGVVEALRSLAAPPRIIVLSAISRYFEDQFPDGTIVLQKPFEVDKLDSALLQINA